jgi:hypothetical protein
LKNLFEVVESVRAQTQASVDVVLAKTLYLLNNANCF